MTMLEFPQGKSGAATVKPRIGSANHQAIPPSPAKIYPQPKIRNPRGMKKPAACMASP